MDDPFAAAQAARARAELRRSTNDAKLRDFRKKVAARLRGDRAKQAAANPYRPPAPRARAPPPPTPASPPRPAAPPPPPHAAEDPDAAAGAGARFAAESPGDDPAADDEDGPAVVASLAPLPSPTEPPFACDLAPQTVPDAFRRPSGKASLFGAAEFVDSDDDDDDDGGGGGGAGPAPAEPADAAIPFPAMRVLDGLEAYKSLARAALLRKAVC